MIKCEIQCSYKRVITLLHNVYLTVSYITYIHAHCDRARARTELPIPHIQSRMIIIIIIIYIYIAHIAEASRRLETGRVEMT